MQQKADELQSVLGTYQYMYDDCATAHNAEYSQLTKNNHKKSYISTLVNMCEIFEKHV